MERQGPMTQARQAFEGLVMPADADELIERLNRARAVGTGTDDGWGAFFPDGSAAFIDWEVLLNFAGYSVPSEPRAGACVFRGIHRSGRRALGYHTSCIALASSAGAAGVAAVSSYTLAP